ncbi:MAG: XRE family transcriptional regulator [Anaerolineaceae bacterium]|nr:XRE family transcriptional regulator [Chloroflexota bacterium]MCY4009949.1 XRE family transcriptional regulator [Anaerolineaceae bacterium]
MIGARIRLARQLAGLTQEGVATALSLANVSATKQAISNYENGKREPSARVLLALAGLLGVRTDYFFYSPKTEINWLAYRGRSTLGEKIKHSIQGYAKDVAALYIELRTLLYPNDAVNFPKRRAVLDVEAAETAAQDLRATWGLSPNHPIENLTFTAESNGVIVIDWNKPTRLFDGLSGRLNDTVPITVVNTVRQVDRIRFNLAHELGHLLMSTTEDQSEKLAHRFAAALLVPAEVARYELGRKRQRISLQELGTLKRRYGLSIQGWIYRAMDLGIISKAYANSLWPQVNQLGWKRKEPDEYAYVADEEPVLLEQMIQRCLKEQLVTGDRIRQVFPQYGKYDEPMVIAEGKFPSSREILAMPLGERERWIAKSIAEIDLKNYEMVDTVDEDIL